MQNVEFACSSCLQSFSKLLVVGSSILFLVLILVISSSYLWFGIPFALSQNSSCFQLTVFFALGLQLLLLLVKTPFAPSLQLLLLLVYNSSWSQSKLLLLLVGSSSCSQLVIPFTLGWQFFLLLVSGSSWSWSNSSRSWSAVLFNHGRSSFCCQFATPFVVALQFLLVLVRIFLILGWQLLLFLVGSSLTHSQLLKGPKRGSKQKTMEERGVGARSLAHNTLRGRGACWSSKMGLGRVDKLHSLTRACTQRTQGGQCIIGALLVLGRTTGNTNTQDSPRPGLGGSHHLPPYSIFCASPQGPHRNGFLSQDSQVGVLKLQQLGLLRL